jgi:hypothetical protein
MGPAYWIQACWVALLKGKIGLFTGSVPLAPETGMSLSIFYAHFKAATPATLTR